MSTPLHDVLRARENLETAKQQYAQAILHANLAGHSVRAIAEILDVSHGTVHTIVKRTKQN